MHIANSDKPVQLYNLDANMKKKLNQLYAEHTVEFKK
jgi:hypothetical protein